MGTDEHLEIGAAVVEALLRARPGLAWTLTVADVEALQAIVARVTAAMEAGMQDAVWGEDGDGCHA